MGVPVASAQAQQGPHALGTIGSVVGSFFGPVGSMIGGTVGGLADKAGDMKTTGPVSENSGEVSSATPNSGNSLGDVIQRRMSTLAQGIVPYNQGGGY